MQYSVSLRRVYKYYKPGGDNRCAANPASILKKSYMGSPTQSLIRLTAFSVMPCVIYLVAVGSLFLDEVRHFVKGLVPGIIGD